MYVFKMCQRTILILLFVSSTYSQLFDFNKLKSYAKIFNVGDVAANDTGNVLWQGLFKDCAKKASFSCIQKNVYTYLDDTFTDRDNITVFDGFVMTKNNLDYHKYSAEYNDGENVEEQNDIDDIHVSNEDESTSGEEAEDENSPTASDDSRNIEDNNIEPLSPLEEVTNALQDKAIQFLATRNYEVQLPTFFFEGTSIKLSPKEVDEDGALIRVDFKHRELSTEGRFFKKIKKFIQSKLVTSFLALLLIIKLIKIKFMFVIPFLFGIGTAKKLFLKLLLFLVPAFAHVFKLCSSYYSGGTKYHHHHHQIAHHHHHVPVPVPIPAYHHDHHPHHHEDEGFDGYDYTQPHIQYRKDVEELKEWGIEPYEDPGVLSQGPYAHVEPAPGAYGMPQYAANARPVTVAPNHLGPFEKYVPQIKYDKPLGPYENPNPNPNIRHTLNNIGMTQFNKNLVPKATPANLGPIGNHAQSLAYNGYFDDVRYTRASGAVTEPTLGKGPFHAQQQHLYSSQIRPGTTFPKNAVFAAKSDNTDTWLSGSAIAENIMRAQNSVQPTAKSPVFVHNIQLGNPTVQNFGQPGLNVQQSQPLSQSAQNVIKSFQHSSNGVPNSQQVLHLTFPMNPSAHMQNSVYNQHVSPQNLQKKIGVPTTGVEIVKQDLPKHTVVSKNQVRAYDDEFYGPILSRLEEIFRQLRFVDEECRDRLVCSMYKNPTIYTPHSNLVSNELSREPEELRHGNRESESGRRFQRYLNAARAGQDGGDCTRLYTCNISTE